MIGHGGPAVSKQRFTVIFVGLLSLYYVRPMMIPVPANRNDITNTHNMYRQLFANGAYNVYVADMNKLVWNNELYQKSRRNLRCDMLNALISSQDMNMNIGISFEGNVSSIIRSWFHEILHFLPEVKTCMNRNKCRRFLTMINSKHREVGCHTTTCGHRNVLLCYYSGGKDDWNIYQTGLPCTKCESDISFCSSGLCESCDSEVETCDCRKNCSRPGVGHGTLNISSCTCECSYGMGPNCDEPCKNPEQYLDYDICEHVPDTDCFSENLEVRNMLTEFCPEKCLCNKLPETNN